MTTSTDLVVVLPGIMGSTLGRPDGDRPAAANLVWAPSAGAVWRAVRTLGRSIQDLRLPDDLGDEAPDDGIEPVALMPDLHAIPGVWTPVKGYDPLVAFLVSLGYRRSETGSPPGNLVLFPYDWRLSNRHNGRLLATTVERELGRWRSQGGRYRDAQAVLVGHSMGGLVARWYLEQCGGAEVTRKLVTLGTPWRGAATALEQAVNGVRRGIGERLALDLTAFSRSLPSFDQLMPQYACIEQGTDFVRTTETTVPELDAARLADAMAFHSQLADAEGRRAGAADMTHMVVGSRQPTATTVRFTGEGAVALETFGPHDELGDGTVPLTGGIGHDLTLDTNRVRRVADRHGNLQRNRAVFDELEEILTAQPVRHRATRAVTLRVRVPELLVAGEPLPLTVDVEDDAAHGLLVTVTDESGRVVDRRQPRALRGHAETSFDDLPPGALTVTVGGPDAASPLAPVTAVCLVAPPDLDAE